MDTRQVPRAAVPAAVVLVLVLGGGPATAADQPAPAGVRSETRSETVDDSGPSGVALGLGATALAAAVATTVVRNRALRAVLSRRPDRPPPPAEPVSDRSRG
ncbi:hypothetical protein [Streptomyces sp. NPDC006551]|uniref:hypothetical protein n=1 Tax=Streptomyces sp. NPDC006551 TaxID=3157178 RepID=UPI0033A77A43